MDVNGFLASPLVAAVDKQLVLPIMNDLDTPKIWFARHAESEANVRHIYANTGCSFPLTDIGLQQAMAVSLQLSCVPIRAIYTSPLLRATQTAEQICKIKKMEMRRFLPFVKRAIENCDGEPGILLMITHGGILGAMLAFVFENLDFTFVQARPIEHLSIIKGELKNGRMVCVEYNGTPVSS